MRAFQRRQRQRAGGELPRPLPIRMRSPVGPQAKLAVSVPGDAAEREADRVAQQMMDGSGTSGDAGAKAAGAPLEAPAGVEERVRSQQGGGEPLPDVARAFFEPRLGHDFSRVRIHAGERAASAARELGAQAFTHGSDIFFSRGRYQPETPGGRALLAHELVHVVQQGATRGPLQRKVAPEDVAVEMVGREFELTADFTTPAGTVLKAGGRVKVVSWSNTSDTVSVTAGAAASFDVPKRLLAPTRTAVSGIDPYSAGVADQAAVVAKGEKALTDWLAKESEYKSEKAKKLFKEERERLEGLLEKRRTLLNRRLIQETMFNRFDAVIKKEVDAANTAHGLTGKDALDPNLVKSMLFQESQLGTAGQHLEVPPSHPVKTRFNLGQVIDSSGLALLTMIEKEQPTYLAMIPDLRKDLVAAQTELAKLKKQKSLTSAEATRKTELEALSRQNWEAFIWSYQTPGSPPVRFADVVADFFAAGSPARNEDYEFWIHMAVLWLFEKRKAGMTWQEAIRAYNGGGKQADLYRDEVVARAKDARDAAKAGKAFIPGGI